MAGAASPRKVSDKFLLESLQTKGLLAYKIRQDIHFSGWLHIGFTRYLQQKYEERTGSSKSPGYPIGTRELKALVLSIPTDQTAQMKLVEHYRQIRDEELVIKKRMRNFHSRLTYLTNPNIMP